jgi:hypothetical protein
MNVKRDVKYQFRRISDIHELSGMEVTHFKRILSRFIDFYLSKNEAGGLQKNPTHL